MREQTTIKIPYFPNSEVICSLINNGWVIDSIKEEVIDKHPWTTIKAHKGEKDKNEKSLKEMLYPDNKHTTEEFGCNRCGWQRCVCDE